MEKREGFFGRFFGISQSGSNMRTEILAGITTFITVAYILILNPQILADPFVRLSEPFSVLFMLKYHWHRHLEWD